MDNITRSKCELCDCLYNTQHEKQVCISNIKINYEGKI